MKHQRLATLFDGKRRRRTADFNSSGHHVLDWTQSILFMEDEAAALRCRRHPEGEKSERRVSVSVMAHVVLLK